MSATIEDQIALEKRMVAHGIARYSLSTKSAEQNGRGADTAYSQRLMQSFIEPIAQAIIEHVEFTKGRPGTKAKFSTLLARVDPYKAAYFGVRTVLNSFMKNGEPIASIAKTIGMCVEDEIKFSQFEKEQGEYYRTIINDFKKKGTKAYRHMHRVLTKKAKEKDVSWNQWTPSERAMVGVKIIDIIIQCTDLIERRDVVVRGKKGGAIATIVPTPQTLKWIKDFNAFAEMLNPDRIPCVIQPDPWVDLENGGYFTPQLRSRTKLVKIRDKNHEQLFNGDISQITTAVNALQNVPWQVNQQVLDVLQQAWDQSLPIGLPQSDPYEIPKCPVPKSIVKKDMSHEQQEDFNNWKAEARCIHTLEKERVSKCFQVIRAFRLANEYRQYDRFWFVYYCDFRGRMYCTVSGLSPQGPDFSKSLLKFADGKVLGERGLYWLRVHGANCFGKDKLSYEDRVRWTEDNEAQILRTAEDPLSNRGFWADCDKPWQFLAFCFEYARWKVEGNGMLSYLPIGLDGSCNGLQNFSAMLRDAVGGQATNLVPGDRPADIYTEVAEVCLAKLRQSTDPLALGWVRYADELHDGCIPRAISKKPVMTLPYGSTRQACQDGLYAYILDNCPEWFPKRDRWKAAMFLTPVLWSSIGEVVIAARAAMDWIQQSASILAKSGYGIEWWTPMGFPVIQNKKKFVCHQIHTELCGHFRLRLASDTDELDTKVQRQGSSPNFVHSMDACHAQMTLHKGLEAGLTHFAFIHDDFGTHAADTDALHECIRQAFVELYYEHDPLLEFKDYNELRTGVTLPDLPKLGSLDIHDVLRSPYFFG